jgi:manganese/zinc/iron transport system permease protein
MSSEFEIGLVAMLAGTACALSGIFLVLRRMAMMADAISHSILPGLVAAYVLANGPLIGWGFAGAAVAGLFTVYLVEKLTKTRRVKEDSAIGLVFPSLFALGVFVISKYLANVHIDTDAVLYGEIAFAPFDTLIINGQSLGPQSAWILGGLTLLNSIFLAVFYKELKISTFDAGLAAALGFAPGLLHYLLMGIVAVTTVGAFSAVGAILSVALIIVPPATASLLSQRLPGQIAISILIAILCSVGGYAAAVALDVSISGMIATVLGVVFCVVIMFAPGQGLVAQSARRRRQHLQFATEMLVMHLASHVRTPDQAHENTTLHLEQELGWTAETSENLANRAQTLGLITIQDGALSLTLQGETLAKEIAERGLHYSEPMTRRSETRK